MIKEKMKWEGFEGERAECHGADSNTHLCFDVLTLAPLSESDRFAERVSGETDLLTEGGLALRSGGEHGVN